MERGTPAESDRLVRGLGASGGVLACLLLAAIVVRGLAAWWLGPVSDDAFHYLSIAQEVEGGNFQPMLHVLDFNVYPLLLALIHPPGADWVTVAKVWGVLVSSLALLPLVCWTDRLFGPRTALAVGTLYAFHPELVETGVEPLREGTLWLFFALSLYFLTRGIQEDRLRHFLAAGFFAGLAILVRSEGWLLAIPAAGWLLARIRQGLSPARAARAAFCLAIGLPTIVLVGNSILFRQESAWHVGRLSHVEMIWTGLNLPEVEWITATARPNPPATPVPQVFADALSHSGSATSVPATHPQTEAAVAVASREKVHGVLAKELPYRNRLAPRSQPLGHHLHRYAVLMVETLNPALLAFAALSLVVDWRRWLASERLPLFAMATVLLLAVWLQTTRNGINSRYFLTTLLVLLPAAGHGIVWAARKWADWERGAEKGVVAMSQRFRRLAGPTAEDGCRRLILAGLSVVFLVQLVGARHSGREADVALGRWLVQQYGPFPTVVTNLGANRLGYYARGSLAIIASEGQPIGTLVDDLAPDLVILSSRCQALPSDETLDFWSSVVGYERIDLTDAPRARGEIRVFRRPRPSISGE